MQFFVSVHDEDSINSDDHVDDVYVEERLAPGKSISEVSHAVLVNLGELEGNIQQQVTMSVVQLNTGSTTTCDLCIRICP